QQKKTCFCIVQKQVFIFKGVFILFQQFRKRISLTNIAYFETSRKPIHTLFGSSVSKRFRNYIALYFFLNIIISNSCSCIQSVLNISCLNKTSSTCSFFFFFCFISPKT